MHTLFKLHKIGICNGIQTSLRYSFKPSLKQQYRYCVFAMHFPQRLMYRHQNANNFLCIGNTMKYSNNSDDNPFKEVLDINPIELAQKRNSNQQNKVDTNFLIIDVREEQELQNNYNLGNDKNDWIHIPMKNLLNLSDKQELNEFLKNKYDRNLDEYQDLYCLCKAGVRSLIVARHLNELDIDQNVSNITGGIMKYDFDVGLD